MPESGPVEDPKDMEKGEEDGPGKVKRWLAEIDASEKRLKDWRTRARKVIDRYAPDKDDPKNNSFNILWSNTQVLRPAIYAQPPKPDIRRRFRDDDPVGRQASRVLERFAEYNGDEGDDISLAEAVLDQYLLTGIGMARIRYTPFFEPGEDVPEELDGDGIDVPFTTTGGEEIAAEDVLGGVDDEPPHRMVPGEDRIVWQEVGKELVQWDRFGWSPAPTWDRTRFIYFEHHLTKRELKAQFGLSDEIIAATNFEVTVDGKIATDADSPTDDHGHDILKRARVYEVWDKENRRVIAVCTGYAEGLFMDEEDPLGLEKFYPGPKPMFGVQRPGSMVPVPEYILYQSLAQEMNEITYRLRRLIEALKVRGVYPAALEGIDQLLSGTDENKLIPIEDWVSFADKGGLKGSVDFLPIQEIMVVVQGLMQQRNALVQQVYEITGISDILRGATDPRETLGAQQLKGQFGALRMRPRQGRFQRFLRDLLQIEIEVVAEHFEPETLELVTGIRMARTREALEQEIALEIQNAQQQGQPPPPQPLPSVLVTWEDVMELISSDQMRGMRIDIETDSTIALDEQAEKGQMVEFIQTIGGYFAAVVPLVAEGAMPKDVAVGIALAVSRRFKISREVEELLEKMASPDEPEGQEQVPQQPGEGEEGETQESAALASAKAQALIQDSQTKAQKVQIDGQKLMTDVQMRQAEIENEARKLDLLEKASEDERLMKMLDLLLKSDSDQEKNAIAQAVADKPAPSAAG